MEKFFCRKKIDSQIDNDMNLVGDIGVEDGKPVQLFQCPNCKTVKIRVGIVNFKCPECG